MVDQDGTGHSSTAVRLAKEDREYLVIMYEDNAEHARKHEELRGTISSIFMALITATLAFVETSDRHNTRLLGDWTIIFSSVLGFVFSEKHFERYMLHRMLRDGFREALEQGVSNSCKTVRADILKISQKQNKWPSQLRARHLWSGLFILTFMIGAIVMYTNSDLTVTIVQ